MYQICSMLLKKTLEDAIDAILVSLLSTLNRYRILFCCFSFGDFEKVKPGLGGSTSDEIRFSEK